MLSRIARSSMRAPVFQPQGLRQISQFTQMPADYDVKGILSPAKSKQTQELMVTQPWTTTPFTRGSQLQLPIYNLLDGTFTGEICELDHQHFNVPLRRDIVSKVFHYFNVKDVRLNKLVKRQGDVAGSGKKPRPQKGMGAARQGNKRAPQRKNGGKAHGPVPRDLTEKINGKLRLKAINIMMSAKLYEDRIILIDSEEIQVHKTKFLEEMIKPFLTDKLMFLLPFDHDEKFSLAAQNLKNVSFKNPQEFNVTDLLKSDMVFMTKLGLQQFEEVLQCRKENLTRNRKVPLETPLSYKKYIGEYNPKSRQDPDYTNIIKPTLTHESLEQEKPLEIFTPSIKQYLEDLQSFQKNQDI